MDEKELEKKLLSKDIETMTDQEYQKWLKIILKLNPNCVNYFLLDIDKMSLQINENASPCR